MIDKEDILERTGRGLAVFKHYINFPVRPGKNFRNPLYEDRIASCNIYYDRHAQVFKMKDFGNNEYSGDCFWFVGMLYGLDVKRDFVGLIVSLGSSTVIGNIIAGLVITYMRPFKIGDRIQLNDTTGNIIEKTPLVTRIRTPKNEVVTVPNSFVMSSHTVNYSTSAREYGLIIHSEVSIGYDIPWRKVNELLIDAALNTPGVVDDPRPFVLVEEALLP